MSKEIFSKEPSEFVRKLAEALKKIPEFEKPEWIDYVKSGVGRERPPEDEDFWHVRAASILRQLYIRGVVGVNKLRTRYGNKKDRGVRPDRFRKGSGKIIRLILQQAEKAGFVEKMDKVQFGRRLTQKGRDFLDGIEIGRRKVEEIEETKKGDEIKEIKSEEVGDGEQKSESKE